MSLMISSPRVRGRKMIPRGNDQIYWAPIGSEGISIPGLVHRCPTAVLIAPTRRDQLDPMAQGKCRYCLQPLEIG